MTDDEHRDAPQDGQSGFRQKVVGIASHIARLDPGPAAALRRGPLAGAGAAAFWQLLSEHDVYTSNERGWAALIQAIAVLTPKGIHKDKRSACDASRSMGGVLCDAGVSDLRLARLLNAPADMRPDAAVRLCRRLARTEDSRRFDIRTLASFILFADDKTDRQIASDYYRAKAMRTVAEAAD